MECGGAGEGLASSVAPSSSLSHRISCISWRMLFFCRVIRWCDFVDTHIQKAWQQREPARPTTPKGMHYGAPPEPPPGKPNTTPDTQASGRIICCWKSHGVLFNHCRKAPTCTTVSSSDKTCTRKFLCVVSHLFALLRRGQKSTNTRPTSSHFFSLTGTRRSTARNRPRSTAPRPQRGCRPTWAAA